MGVSSLTTSRRPGGRAGRQPGGQADNQALLTGEAGFTRADLSQFFRMLHIMDLLHIMTGGWERGAFTENLRVLFTAQGEGGEGGEKNMLMAERTFLRMEQPFAQS